jgi:hypothetical protein
MLPILLYLIISVFKIRLLYSFSTVSIFSLKRISELTFGLLTRKIVLQRKVIPVVVPKSQALVLEGIILRAVIVLAAFKPLLNVALEVEPSVIFPLTSKLVNESPVSCTAPDPSTVAPEKVVLPIVPEAAVMTPALVTLKGAAVAVLLPAQKAMPDSLGEIPTLVAFEPAINVVAPIVNPPIVPLLAVIAPVIVAFVATKAPVCVTLKGALVGVALPAEKAVAPVEIVTVFVPVPAVSVELLILQPAIFPELEIKLPEGVTIKGAKFGLLFPAQNATPLLFGDIPTLVVPDPAINSVELIVKPPMVPAVADMFPVIDKEEPFQTSLFPEGLPILSVPPPAFVK